MKNVRFISKHFPDIPKDWQLSDLEDVADIVLSNVDKKSKKDEKDVFLCNYTDVYYNEYITKDLDFMLSTASDREIKKFSLVCGDVIITKDSETPDDIAVPALVKEDMTDVLCGYHLAILRPNNKQLLGSYLSKLLSLQAIRHYFYTLANGVTRFGLTGTAIRGSTVIFPSLSEQKKIAKILGKWDEGIEKTEKLIDAKKGLKKGLMQQLLTGKKRFKEFKGQRRKEYRLGKIFKHRKESGYGHLPLLAITGSDGVRSRDGLERRDTSSEDKSRYLRICLGDIGYNTMRMWQGVNGVSELEGIVSPAYTICIPDKKVVDSVFMGYLFKFHPVVFLFYRYSQGMVSDTWNLKFRHFSEIKVTVPPLKEQQKIASVLSAADREIDLLINERESLKDQKKGLMQKLLTGKIRVKI